MKINVVFLIHFLFLHNIQSAPTGKRPHENGEIDCEEPAPKKANIENPIVKTEYNNDENDEDDDSDDKSCYFSKLRLSRLETENRPVKSIVSTKCEGETVEMRTINSQHGVSLYDSANHIDLMMCRGAGKCNLNWSDQKTAERFGKKKVCENHIKELYTEWLSKDITLQTQHVYLARKEGTRHRTACSWPKNMEPTFHRQKRRPLGMRTLMKSEANAVLEEKGILLHPGLPLCSNHKTFVQNNFAKWLIDTRKPIHAPSSLEDREDAEYCPISDENSCPKKETAVKPILEPNVQAAVENLAIAAELNNVKPRHVYKSLAHRVKKRKICRAEKLIEIIFQYMAPDSWEILRDVTLKKVFDIKWISEDGNMDKVMKHIVAQYQRAESRRAQIRILSLVANAISYSQLHYYIPGLHASLYYRAKKYAREAHIDVVVEKKLERYNPENLQKFIEFITSPIVMIGLPYGTLKTRTSDGTKIDIPQTIRQQSHTEILKMYKAHLIELGEEGSLMSDSTIYGILETCTATSRKATSCVDYYIADGMEAFEFLKEILHELLKNDFISQTQQKELTLHLEEAMEYLRTDFRMHVKINSRVPDHCAVFSLSDPDNDQFNQNCGHDHSLKCDRCEQVKIVLMDIQDEVHDVVKLLKKRLDAKKKCDDSKEKTEFLLWKNNLDDVFSSTLKIEEMKKHLLRSAFTEDQRQKIIENLSEGQALLTMDYAQKYAPRWHRERQRDYFAKKGISYHVIHTTAKIDGSLKQHSYVHIQSFEKQDSLAVTSILEHTLLQLKKNGVDEVFLRSDNAGPYHSSSTIASLPGISKRTKVRILRYAFSEAQNGKSSSDRVARIAKGKAERYLNRGRDITTGEELFQAFTSDDGIAATSVYLGFFERTKISDFKMRDIMNFSDFYAEDENIRAFRYGKIGEGYLVLKEELKGNVGVWKTLKTDDKKYERKDDSNEDESSVPEFWFVSLCRSKKTCPTIKEAEVVNENTDDDGFNEVIGKLFSCPENGCSAEYLTFSGLERHVLRGKHTKQPNRMNIRDRCLGMFEDRLEGIDESRTVSKSVSSALQDTIMDDSVDSGLVLKKGWALKTKSKSKRFTEDQKEFLYEQFTTAKAQGRIPDTHEIEKTMKSAQKSDGSLRFLSSERLNWRQISTSFGRMIDASTENRKKRSVLDVLEFDEDIDGEVEEEFLNHQSFEDQSDLYLEDIEKSKNTLFAVSK